MSREMFDADGQAVRREQVPDFRHDSLGLPLATYPEVALPFLLAWMPLDGQRRSVYAWINDRFIAKVYVEVEGRHSISIRGTTHDTIEVIMYPDLNDWIPMGAMITRLVKPFVPKYRMWYARQAAVRARALRGSLRTAGGSRGGARGHALKQGDIMSVRSLASLEHADWALARWPLQRPAQMSFTICA